MDKAPEAFRTISEVADDLDVPQHVLRFWETRFAQIKPMKRGGGRRYYRPDDLDLLRGIRHLLYGQGYTIRGVQRLLKDNGVKYVQGVWRRDEEGEAADPRPKQSSPREAGAPSREHDPELDAARVDHVPITPELSERGEAEEEPVLSEFPSQEEWDDRAEEPPQAPVVSKGIGADERQRLMAALEELEQCRQLLQSALRDD